jgi:hypothetical protein
MCEIKLHVKLPSSSPASGSATARPRATNTPPATPSSTASSTSPRREALPPSPPSTTRAGARRWRRRGRRVLDWLREDATQAYDHYEAMISQEGQQGLARELARMNLPMNVYTQWYWKTNLHNLLNFLRLRADAPRPVRDPRLRRGHRRHRPRLGPLRLERLRGLPRGRRPALRQGGGGAQAEADGEVVTQETVV